MITNIFVIMKKLLNCRLITRGMFEDDVAVGKSFNRIVKIIFTSRQESDEINFM